MTYTCKFWDKQKARHTFETHFKGANKIYCHEHKCSLFREAFKIFDRNRDGYIDMKELRRVTAMLGTMLSQEEIEEFMAEADRDGNGKLDYEEFVKMLMSY